MFGREQVDRIVDEPTPGELVLLARRALMTEAHAIESFAQTLGDGFAKAILMLCQPKGRIIVTGMGKSGHAGRKIAATLSSVGRPAMFVHPSEASHGDLGMIMEGDLLFAISNSGETLELMDILTFCRGLGLPLLALVGPAESTLARRADHFIAYGVVEEVCAIGLAPTTSTTLAIAIGDALTAGIMRVLGTTRDHFYERHPRGRLGAALLKASDLMHVGPALPLVSPDLDMQEVVQTMSEKGFGIAIVCDGDNKALGVITDGDVRRQVRLLPHARAAELVSAPPITVAPTVHAIDALTLMTSRAITSLVVSDVTGRVLGLLHIHDCLRAGL